MKHFKNYYRDKGIKETDSLPLAVSKVRQKYQVHTNRVKVDLAVDTKNDLVQNAYLTKHLKGLRLGQVDLVPLTFEGEIYQKYKRNKLIHSRVLITDPSLTMSVVTWEV